MNKYEKHEKNMKNKMVIFFLKKMKNENGKNIFKNILRKETMKTQNGRHIQKYEQIWKMKKQKT